MILTDSFDFPKFSILLSGTFWYVLAKLEVTQPIKDTLGAFLVFLLRPSAFSSTQNFEINGNDPMFMDLWIKALQEVWRDFYESFTNDQTQEGPGSRKPANPKNNPIFCKIFLSIESI